MSNRLKSLNSGRRHRGRVLVRASVAMLASVLMGASFVSVAAAAPARSLSQIRILPVAVLEDGGRAMTVSMVVRCPPGDHMREGFVGAAQDGAGFLIGYPLVCDGLSHLARATFTASDAGLVSFHRGDADVHAIIFDEATGTSVLEQSRTVHVRGPLRAS